MWCVADLNDDYIDKMEDVLETYERPYDAAQPVVCLDENPITLHADVRPASPATPRKWGGVAKTSGAFYECLSSFVKEASKWSSLSMVHQ